MIVGQIKKWVLRICLIFLFCSPVWAEQDFFSRDDHLAELIEKTKRSIVAVGTHYFNDVPKNKYMGTGFVIGSGRRIVTNYHVIHPVVEKKRQAYLRIFHKRFGPKGIKARIVAENSFHDLAILEHDDQPLPALRLAHDDQAKAGFKIAFTGYPLGLILGLNPTTHTGIISSVAPLVRPSPSARIIDGSLIRHLNDPYDILQIDATAYPGNSGSPVYRIATGEVVGVINKVFVQGKKEHAITNPTGITYAIPVRFVKTLEKKIGSSRQ